tara:strand:- start:1175 stop:1465 length:291 start_codon:yes stop_codon:yes gene_type:complete
MRRVLGSDVTAAARALRAVPSERRAALCARLFQEADWADRYTRRLGRVHVLWGNGTLMAAACARRLAAEQDFADTEYCDCFHMVISALVERNALAA